MKTRAGRVYTSRYSPDTAGPHCEGRPWQADAYCQRNPDLYYATGEGDRALALHGCRSHCPVLRQCRAAADLNPCGGAVHAGTVYNTDYQPTPIATQPRPSGRACTDCHPELLVEFPAVRARRGRRAA